MKIVVGLGNIGEKYIKSRHNCGFLVLDQFVKELEEEGIKVDWKEESKLKAITAKISYKNETIYLVKPTTLMNLSGESVSKILNFFKEPLEHLTVVYDDIDLPLGTIRIREKGSAGTHNGMRSVIEKLANENFNRIRIGIESRGQQAPEHQDLHSFVLSDFLESEYEEIAKALKEAVKELKKSISA